MSPALANLLACLGAVPAKAAAPAAPLPPPAPKTTLDQEDFVRAAAAIGCDVAAVKAVAEVESSGSGFLPDGRPVVLFEAHRFDALTGGRFRGAKDRSGVSLSVASWDRSLYGAAGAHQHDRIEDAAKLDASAALKAASWGAFQIMGENHRLCGFPTVEAFVAALRRDADAHLNAMIAFCKVTGLGDELRDRRWADFARGYNGKGYAANKYDTKLAAAFARHSAKGVR